MEIKEAFNLVLGDIKPTKLEEKEVKEVSKKIINKIKIKDTKIIPGGSGAKGTWLRDDYDVDLYVKFNYKKYKLKDISKILGKELNKRFKKVERLHGSRDYYRIKEDKYTFEIIPILDIKKPEEALNITDLSPFHTKYVGKYKRLADDIRLAKAFCKAQRFYGAESYIMGFSGYVLEILVIHYGSFLNLLKNAAKWKENEIIGNKKDAMNLNISKKYSPLIIIDPVQKDRNASAALSKEVYNNFINAAKEFLNNPSKEFFEAKELSFDELKTKAGSDRLIHLEATPLNGKEDVVGAKIVRCFNFIKTKLEENEFGIKESDWHWNKKANFWFIIYNRPLEKTKKHYGPPLRFRDSVENFKKKWKGYKFNEESGIIYVEVERKFTDPVELVKAIIKEKNINTSVKDIRIIL
ncbi:CCA tRNA nucleotidyltransferase [Candidatus Woesearchaeota archaeon]|nr:CCA tRNA nucleotidyltransferase [Candidatus Woesearchaeota archaeon]